jgi:hypothetical protein
MKRIGLLIGFFALLFIVLPSLIAQDAKKRDPDKAEKNDEAKKDDPKKTDDPEKGKDKDEPIKEKLNYSFAFVTKIISVHGESGREFTVETKEVDQKKLTDVQTWQAQRIQQLTQQAAQMQQQFNQASTQKDPKARATALQNAAKAQANYQNDVYKFQVELAKKDIYTTKPHDVRAHDEAKVRAMTPPVEFDDLGFEKKWTKKELEERMDKTGLPGFAVEFDQLKSGQYVAIYMAKAPPKDKDKDKDQPKKKKGPDDDPPSPEVKSRPEFIMIVILQQPAPPK